MAEAATPPRRPEASMMPKSDTRFLRSADGTKVHRADCRYVTDRSVPWHFAQYMTEAELRIKLDEYAMLRVSMCTVCLPRPTVTTEAATATRRVVMYQDEWDTLHIDTSERDRDELKNRGILVPHELIREQDRINAEWGEHQKRLTGWLDEWASMFGDAAETARGVVLYEARTWDQFAALETCDHAVILHTVKSREREAGSCEPCGSYVHRRHVRNSDGDFVVTDEIVVSGE